MELVKTDKEKNVIKPPLFTNTEKKKTQQLYYRLSSVEVMQ